MDYSINSDVCLDLSLKNIFEDHTKKNKWNFGFKETKKI